MTELLQRACLAVWAGRDEVGARPIGPRAPHVLTHALDVLVVGGVGAQASLDAAVEGLAALPRDYLYWAALSATALAAERLGDARRAAVIAPMLAECDVHAAVVAVGTAVLPVPALHAPARSGTREPNDG